MSAADWSLVVRVPTGSWQPEFFDLARVGAGLARAALLILGQSSATDTDVSGSGAATCLSADLERIEGDFSISGMYRACIQRCCRSISKFEYDGTLTNNAG